MKYIKPYQIFESAESLWRVAPSSIHGQGCFAIVDLPAETDLGLLHTILPDGYDHTELGHMYNHSTTPNCYNKKIGNQRFLVTIRPVKMGEELTGDYRLQPDLEQPQPDWIGESQEEVDTAKRLLDLGLMEPQDYKQKLRELGWDKKYRNQFVEALEKLFADLGLEWRNWATDRQRKNGTVLLKFSPADAAELIFTATVPPGLTPRQAARFQNIKERLLKVKREMEMDVEVRGRLAFEYWIFPGSFRPSGHFGEPTSSQTVNFDGSTDPQHSMARFLYQVALDADAKGWIWNPQHPHYNFARR